MVVRFPQFLVSVELDEKISQSGLGLEDLIAGVEVSLPTAFSLHV